MPDHLSTVVNRVESISLGRVRTFHSRVDMVVPQSDGRPLVFQMTPKASLGTITVQSADVRYKQKRAGYERWVNLSLCVPVAVREQLERLEGRLRDLLRPRYQQIDNMWSCNVVPFVADMCLTGEHPCRILNTSGAPIKPTDWTAVAVVPIVALRCLCVHQAGVFADYEVVSILVAGQHDVAPDAATFL